MTPTLDKEKILEENRRVHSLENHLYLARHPEQTNFFQNSLVEKTLDQVCAQLNPEAKVLDLGCGTGYLFLRFLKRGFNVTGLDISNDMIQVTNNSISENEKHRAHLVIGDVEEYMDKNQDIFNLIIFSAVLHHLFDYEMVLRKTCKSLKIGAKVLIFFEPLKQEINSPIRYAFHKTLSWLDEKLYRLEMGIRKIPLFENEYHHSDYQRQFGGINPKNVEKILREESFSILKLEKYCARRFGISAWLANRFLQTQNTFNIFAIKT